MTIALLCLFYAGAGAAWFARTRSLVHPGVVHCVSWLVPLLWHWVYLTEADPVSPALGLLLASASVAFFVPLVVWAGRPARPREPPPRLVLSGIETAVICFVLTAPLLSSILAARVVGTGFSLLALRDLFVNDAAPPAIGIGFTFPLVVAALHVVRRSSAGWILRASAWASALMMAVLSTSKIYFLIILLVVAVPLMEGRTALIVRRILLAGVAGVAVFVLLHLTLGKVIGADELFTTGDLVRAVLLTMAIYFGGSISALDQELASRAELPDGYWYFGLPGGGDPSGKVLPFTFVADIGTNVYGAYAPPLHEFGPAGVLAFMLVLGGVYAALHGRRTRPGGEFLYAFSLFPLIFMFHNEFYFGALNIWIGFLFVSTVLARSLRAHARG